MGIREARDGNGLGDLETDQARRQAARVSLTRSGSRLSVRIARDIWIPRVAVANPRRWSVATRDWTPRGAVTLNPERDAVINAATVS